MPAPVFGAVGTALSGTSTTSAAVPVPSGVTAGQIIIVDLYLEANRTITPPAGFTQIGSTTATAIQWHSSYWKRATASDTGTYTFTWTTATYRIGFAHRYTGAIASGNPIDVFNAAFRSTQSNISPAVSVTTTGIDRLLIWTATCYSAAAWTPPSGYTERLDNANEVTLATRTQAAAGSSGSITGTGPTNMMTARLIALLPGSTDQTVTATGIASAEAVGSPFLVPGGVELVVAPGIESAEVVGQPRIDHVIKVEGIASDEAIGSPVVTIGDVIAPPGIPSAQAFGTPTLTAGPVTVTAGGIATAQAVGTPSVVMVIAPATIPSGQAIGSPVLTTGPVTTTVGGIPTAEAVGAATVVVGQITVTVGGIPSAEAIGAARVTMTLYVGGIPTAGAVTAPTITVGAIAIVVPGIPSREAFGTPAVDITLDPRARILPRRARLVPIYELLVVARVPSASGPPQLLEVDALEWSTLSWASTLSRPQTLTVTCRASSVTEVVAQRLRSPDRQPTELWLLRNGKIVFAGPMVAGRNTGDELTLDALGLLAYLDWMIVLSDLRFANVEQFAIVKKLVDQWQTTEFANFGIDTTSVGSSGITRSITYVRDEIHVVSQRIQEMGQGLDGFDAEVDPTTRELTLWYPGKGIDRSAGEDAVVFDARNITGQDAMFSISPADIASDAFGAATSSEADKTYWSTKFNSDLRAAFGRTAISASYQDIDKQNQLDAQVQGLLNSRDQALRAPGRSVSVTADSDLDSYDVGDVVSFELDALLRIGGAFRIRSRKVSVAQTGAESVDLEFV